VTKAKNFSLKELADILDTKLVGDPNCQISCISSITNAADGSISFLANNKYKENIKNTSASAIIISDESITQNHNKNFLISKNPYLAYAKLSKLFNMDIQKSSEIHPSASICNTCKVGKNVFIGPNTYIGPNCTIGDNVIINANCSIVKNVEIGSNTIINFNTVLGSDGFGYAKDKNDYVKIEQLGSLIIGNNVEIGAGCTVDRGAIDNTEIHDGVKFDNQIHIAHNVIIGKNSAIAASCAIAGSTKIGENFQMGGLSGVLGHLAICDNVTVGAHTLITKNINSPGNYIGIMPSQKKADWAKSSIFIKRRKLK